MRRIRIGQDIKINVSLKSGDALYDLTGKTVKCHVISNFGITDIDNLTIQGNTISFDYNENRQKCTGKHFISIDITDGERKYVVDSSDGFKLVDNTVKEGGQDMDVKTESLD